MIQKILNFFIIMLNCYIFSYSPILTHIIKKEILQASYICKLSYKNLKLENFNDYPILYDYDKYYTIYDDKIYILHNNKKINICFRGSYTIKDFLINFNICQKKYNNNNNIKIHAGYLNFYLNIKNSIKNKICEIIQKHNISDIIFTGHSLGGSIATIASYDSTNYINNINIKCITFGSPKVGNKNFIDDYNKKILYSYRIVNNNDLIEYTPPIFLFKHIHEPIYLKTNNLQYPHNISNYIINLQILFDFNK